MADPRGAAAVSGEPTVIHEYHCAAQPRDWLKPLPVRALDSADAKMDAVTYLDLSDHIGVESPASSPNLAAGFVRVAAGSSVDTHAVATSQAFFVVRGRGSTSIAWPGAEAADDGDGTRVVGWSAGDLFTVPAGARCVHDSESGAELPCLGGRGVAVAAPASETTAEKGGDSGAGEGAAVLYWVHDGPLLAYLGVAPVSRRFEPALYERARLEAEVERVRHEPGAAHRNRLGILLSCNAGWAERTKTLTPTLWALLNVLPGRTVQPPHKHNSVALDLAVQAPEGGGAYTLMSPELSPDGELVDPVRMQWRSGAVFVTPPGWWHSHHNETDEEAWVLPVQDAGLHTHMQTLDITFAPRREPVT